MSTTERVHCALRSWLNQIEAQEDVRAEDYEENTTESESNESQNVSPVRTSQPLSPSEPGTPSAPSTPFGSDATSAPGTPGSQRSEPSPRHVPASVRNRKRSRSRTPLQRRAPASTMTATRGQQTVQVTVDMIDSTLNRLRQDMLDMIRRDILPLTGALMPATWTARGACDPRAGGHLHMPLQHFPPWHAWAAYGAHAVTHDVAHNEALAWGPHASPMMPWGALEAADPISVASVGAVPLPAGLTAPAPALVPATAAPTTPLPAFPPMPVPAALPGHGATQSHALQILQTDAEILWAMDGFRNKLDRLPQDARINLVATFLPQPPVIAPMDLHARVRAMGIEVLPKGATGSKYPYGVIGGQRGQPSVTIHYTGRGAKSTMKLTVQVQSRLGNVVVKGRLGAFTQAAIRKIVPFFGQAASVTSTATEE